MKTKRALERLYLIVATKDDQSSLIQYQYAGTAVFPSIHDAVAHIETIRADGIQYAVVGIACSSVTT